MRRLALRLFAALVGLPILYVLAGFAGALIPSGIAASVAVPTARIGLARGPIHYDILLPLTPAIRDRFAFAEALGVPVLHPDMQWLVVGWGARSFYTTVGTYGDLNAGDVWHGLVGDTSVMHLGIAGPIGDHPQLTWLPVSEAQLTALTGAVFASFATDSDGLPIPLRGIHFGPTDAFYVGNGRFHIGRTCNVWVGEVLRQAGIPFGIWTPTPQAVQLSLWWFRAASGG